MATVTSGAKAGTYARIHVHTIVLKCMMGRTHDPISIPSAITDEANRKPVQTDVIAYLLKGAGIDKRGDAVDPRSEPNSAKATCHRDHVLLGNPGIDKPITGHLPQRLQCTET